MAGLLNLVRADQANDFDPSQLGLLNNLLSGGAGAGGGAPQPAPDLSAAPPLTGNSDEEDNEALAQPGEQPTPSPQAGGPADLTGGAGADQVLQPPQASDGGQDQQGIAGLLMQGPGQQQPQQQGLLGKLFGTDETGATFRDRMLAASMGLRGDLSGEGSYLQGIQQRTLQRQMLQRQLASQQVIGEATRGSMYVDKATGRMRLDTDKFQKLTAEGSQKYGVPIDPNQMASTLKNFSEDAGWEMSKPDSEGNVWLVNKLNQRAIHVAGPSKPIEHAPGTSGTDFAPQPLGETLGPGGVPVGGGGGAAGTPPPPQSVPPNIAPGAAGGPGGASDWAPVLDTTPRDGARAATPSTPNEVFRLAQVGDSEAGGESKAGKIAAMSVALNRVASGYQGAKSLSDVLTVPNFNGLATGKGPSAETLQLAKDMVAGKYADPTNGADHYLNPELQVQQGRAIPDWAKGWEQNGQRIGRHVFLGGKAPAGQQVAAAASAAGQPASARQPVAVKTPQEAMQLPPGTPIILPDGRRKIVPGAPQQTAQAGVGTPAQGQPQVGPGGAIHFGPTTPVNRKATPQENVANGQPADAPGHWNLKGEYGLLPGTGYNQANSVKQLAAAYMQNTANVDTLNNINDAIHSTYGTQYHVGLPGGPGFDFSTPAAGWGQMFGKVPESGALRLKTQIESIQAALSKDTLEQMRAMSPRGGAFGNTSTREFNAIASTVRKLNASNSPEELRADLIALRDHYTRWQNNIHEALKSGVTAWGNPYAGVMADTGGGMSAAAGGQGGGGDY